MGSQQGGEFTSHIAPFRPAGWPFRFVGRKRGELKISRTTLQHAGSGLWLGMWTAPGNGDWRNYRHKAIAGVREVCTTAGLCYERALIRVDGEGGNTPFSTGCQEAGLHHLTRIAAYELFDIPAICLHLNAAVWHEVEDSGSGPKRYSVDLGRIQLPCFPRTLREDGTPFAPVISRVVVARYCSETGRGAGRWLDGWNYELFATDLEAEAYVAPEVVTHPPKLNTADGAARRIGSGRRTASWDWIGYTATISHLY